MKTCPDITALPILYSLRNCPYAMRARMAIYYSQQPVILRDVVLSNKPEAMLVSSPKGTVPVLVLSEKNVIEESLEVMLWALGNNDPDDFLHSNNHEALAQMLTLITRFDNDFKVSLEAYKCAKRYHEADLIQRRQTCELYIQDLEQRLIDQNFLMSSKSSLVDIALLPFIRQFARVERQWYLQSPYPHLRKWLNNYLQSRMFSKVMAKSPLWSPENEAIIFGPSICGKV